MIQPIETRYNGYHFRSRLEARWAVFFDDLSIKYEYEKEGFRLDDGTLYLPDFWLPSLNLWVEIKGALAWETHSQHGWRWQTSPELELCAKFRDAQRWPVACIVGMPGEEQIWFYGWDMTDGSAGSFETNEAKWCHSHGLPTLHVTNSVQREILADNLVGPALPHFTWPTRDGYSTARVTQAYVTARSARFEHGESPKRSRHG